MATIVADTGGGNWTTGATWVGGIAPTAADDAQLIVTSGNVTIDTGAVCRGLDCTGYTGTLTHTAGVTLTIGDGTAALGNTALVLATGMTYTLGSSTSTLGFVSTSATVQSITFSGKPHASLTFNGAGGSWILSDTSTMAGSTSVTTLTAGTLNTNGQTCSWVSFASANSNTRTLTLGSSSITVSVSGLAWDTSTASNLTITANTATITLSGAAARISSGSGSVYSGTSVVLSGSGSAIFEGGFTCANLTRTGTGAKTDALSITSSPTITGTLTLNGNSATNRILVTSNTLGTARTITAATVSVTNADFRDITGAGAGSWNLAAITGLSGDCGGNSGITFTTTATQTYTGGTDNWSTAAKWTSRVPLPQDNVLMSGVTGGTITADMPRLGKSIDWTGASGSPTWAVNVAATDYTIYGSLTLISGMNVSFLASNRAFYFEGRSAFTLTSAGKTLSTNANVYVVMVGGTLTLQDALTTWVFYVANGTFNANNFNVTAAIVASNFTTTRSVLMGSGTWTLTFGSITVWNVLSSALTLDAGTSTIAITDTGASSKTFAGGGLTYYNFKIAGGGAGAITITGANTFNRIYTDGGGTKSIVLPGSTTTTLLSGDRLQNGTNVITFTASAGSATVSKSSGYVDWNYVNLTNIISTGGSTFYAGANSTDGGGNTGWIFTNPVGKSNMFSFF